MSGGLGDKRQIKFPSWSTSCSALSGVVLSLIQEALYFIHRFLRGSREVAVIDALH